MSVLSSDSKRLLSTAFGGAQAWLIRGRYDATDTLEMKGEGPAGSFPLPDDMDLYYCVSSIAPGGNRTKPERVYVLAIDDVGKEIDKADFEMMLPLVPSYVVESSAGSYQVGFFIDGGMTPEDYTLLRRAMASNPIWGKAHNKAAANIYRLPQGTHTKSTRGGWKVRLEAWTGAKYTPAELWALFGQGGSAAKVSGGGSKGDYVDSPELLRKLVDMIPNPKEDWDLFVNVGRAIWGASSGLGFDIFEAWASKLKEADPALTLGRWNSYHDAIIGRFWLLRLAKAADPVGAEAWLKEEMKGVFDDGVTHPTADAEEDDAVLALQRDVANLIVRTHGAGIRYNVSTSFWHQFTGIWKESPHDLGYRLAKRWADANAGALGTAARAAVSKSAFYEGVSKIVRADPAIAVVKTDFDRDDWLLGTPAGTVELRTGKLRASAASEMISLSCVTAPAETEDCPRWKAFIDWACTDPATKKADLGMRKMLRQWAGYCLTGDVSEEKVMFLHGGGANGKGTFIETMQWVMGGYFHMAVKDMFMATKFSTHTEDVATLAGKRMVAADEVPTSARWNESFLKSVSGGGTINSRHLYGKSFTFPIRFKVTIIGNEKPLFQGAINEALKRRLHLIEFRMTAKPVDKGLKTALRGEAAGILRWAIGGLVEMLAEGALHIADSSLTATKEYFNENDHFGEWLDENTEPTPGRHGPSSELFKNWKEWVFGQGYSDPFSDQKKFKAEMLRRGKIWRETKTGNVFNDISIKIFDNVK